MTNEAAGKTVLHVETGDGHARISVTGRESDILLGYTALTVHICGLLGTNPVSLALALPQMIADFRSHTTDVTGTTVKTGLSRFGGAK